MFYCKFPGAFCFSLPNSIFLAEQKKMFVSANSAEKSGENYDKCFGVLYKDIWNLVLAYKASFELVPAVRRWDLVRFNFHQVLEDFSIFNYFDNNFGVSVLITPSRVRYIEEN